MRHLTTLIVTFFTGLLFSQPSGQEPTAFVWAKSGLTLRATAAPDGEKISVIPFGTEVTVDPSDCSAELQIPVLPEVRVSSGKSLSWEMPGRYTKVLYGELTGYVFDTYLLPYQAPEYKPGIPGYCCDTLEGMGDWMNRVFGKPDTISSNYSSSEMIGSFIIQYPNGVLDYGTSMQGAGGIEMVWPGLSLARGFVLMDHFWSISDGITKGGVDYHEQILLTDKKHNLLEFWLGQTSDGTVIQQVGMFLHISSYASC